MEPVFSRKDLELIQSLVYDPTLEPSYEYLKGCLVWSDERPNGVTPDAYRNISSLWVARSLLHRGLTLADHPINPAYAQDIWDRAIHQIGNWPGFKRLTLSQKDLNYYEEEMNKARSEQAY